MTEEPEAALLLERLLPHLAALGITRVADVTGLDRIGLPVALAVRPLGRALAVNQGKGPTLAAAKLSAIFEAAEQAAAESHRLSLLYGTAAERSRDRQLADCDRLPRRQGSPFNEHYPVLWTAAQGLQSGEDRLVPYELVHSDFTFPQPAGSGCFTLSTSGLGAGFSRERAVTHALLEAIERDQATLLELGDPAAAVIDFESVRNPQTQALLQRCADGGVLVAAVDATGDLGVPTVSCRVMERDGDSAAMAHAAEGSAARADPEAALLAALMEALQSRLAYISGTRDDLHPADYEPHDRTAELRQMERLSAAARAGRSLAGIGDPSLRSGAGLLAALVERVLAAGCGEPLVVDLPPPAPGVHVARVLVPGFESSLHPTQSLGPRAQAAQRRSP